MSALDRRRFLQTIATLVPAGALTGCAGTDRAGALEGPTLDAVGEAALPGELGPEGIRGAVAGFRQWLAEYQPVAELNHGYGTGELEYTPPHPGPGWTAQLAALDLEAERRHGMRFAGLTLDQRREMLRGVLARERSAGLPDPADARHVALGLLAHFYGSPAATDLCYRASIGRYGCRPLADAVQRPRPLGS